MRFTFLLSNLAFISSRVMMPRPFLVVFLLDSLTARGERLTLQAALDRARGAAPQVKLAALVVREAEASSVGQGLILPVNPRLFADYRPLTIELPGQPVDPRNGYNLGVDGQVEVSGAGGARLTEAARRVDVARAELRFEQTQSMANAWLAFVSTQLASEHVARLREAVALQERVAAAARERVANGVAGEPDVTTVAVELATVRRELLDAERHETEARVALQHVLDWPRDEPMELATIPLSPSEVQGEEQLINQAQERRPELQAAKARLSLLESTDARLLREAIPRLGYNLGLDAAPASPVFAYVGLAVELPIAQRNQGPRAVVSAQLDTERNRLELQLKRVDREVTAARLSYLSRRAQVELIERDALPNARRTVELIESGWRAGRLDVFRLTAASRELVRVERERIDSLFAAWTDFIALQRVAGGLNP
jgi:cobalt-zinc-cadmium efflux system outer membrane protein